jgi:hypothetical protein
MMTDNSEGERESFQRADCILICDVITHKDNSNPKILFKVQKQVCFFGKPTTHWTIVGQTNYD